VNEAGNAQTPSRRAPGWLNRNVAAMGATSLLSDASHEAATAVLPAFLAALGLPPLALGVIEGASDALASFVKLGAGWVGDRTGARWAISTGGYVLTGIMPLFFALAVSWPLVLLGKLVGWFGRGIRGPLRDAMLADSVSAAERGRAFGFHRAGDTLGAVLGPLLAVLILGAAVQSAEGELQALKTVFWFALLPGLAAAAAFGFFVRDPNPGRRSAGSLLTGIRSAPPAFRRFLGAVGLFGAGDFAPGLLILAATTLLAPTMGLVAAGGTAALLYVLRNLVYALASYPAGALSDRTGRPMALLAGGYGIGAVTALGTALAFTVSVDQLIWFAGLFMLSGILAAAQDTLEGVATAELSDPDFKATSFGLLGSVNGVGDLIASVGVGVIWTLLSPIIAFAAAGVAMCLGAVWLAMESRTEQPSRQ
jgi:MFS family permease